MNPCEPHGTQIHDLAIQELLLHQMNYQSMANIGSSLGNERNKKEGIPANLTGLKSTT